jgi:hypothetical protein
MDQKTQDFFKLLFNANEKVCVQDSKFATHSVPLEEVLSGKVTLIPKDSKYSPKTVSSDKLILVALNPAEGLRCDENIVKYRSFLVELDVGSIPEQLNTIKHLKMPFSAQVFSGNKSVHTVITVDEDLNTESQYRMIAKWIFAIVTSADKKCENPSRCIRIPEVYREPGKKQRLIRLKERVTHKELFAWLNRWPHLQPKPKVKKIIPEGEADYDKLSNWAKYQIKNGIEFKNGRSNTWHGLAYDFALAGYSEEQTIEELGKYYQEESDFREKEWLGTIESAFKRVDKK